MGRLTDLLVKDCKENLEKVFSDLETAVDYGDDFMQPLITVFLKYQLDRLFFYNEKEAVVYASRFNSSLLKRKDLQPAEVRESIYSPEKDEKNTLKLLSFMLSELAIEVIDYPEDFKKKELYLYVVQKMAPINLEVSQGYVDHFNEVQKQRATGLKSKKCYQISDRGKGSYMLGLEKQ